MLDNNIELEQSCSDGLPLVIQEWSLVQSFYMTFLSKFLLITLLLKRSFLYWIIPSPSLTTPLLQILNFSFSTFNYQSYQTLLLHYPIPLLVCSLYLINSLSHILCIQNLFLLSDQINQIYHKSNLYIFHFYLHLLFQFLIYLLFHQLLHLSCYLPYVRT